MFGSLADARNDFGVNEVTFFAANLDWGIDKKKLVESMQKEAGEEDGGDISHAHGHAGMAGLGLLHGVHGKRPDGICHAVMPGAAVRNGFGIAQCSGGRWGHHSAL